MCYLTSALRERTPDFSCSSQESIYQSICLSLTAFNIWNSLLTFNDWPNRHGKEVDKLWAEKQAVGQDEYRSHTNHTLSGQGKTQHQNSPLLWHNKVGRIKQSFKNLWLKHENTLLTQLRRQDRFLVRTLNLIWCVKKYILGFWGLKNLLCLVTILLRFLMEKYSKCFARAFTAILAQIWYMKFIWTLLIFFWDVDCTSQNSTFPLLSMRTGENHFPLPVLKKTVSAI